MTNMVFIDIAHAGDDFQIVLANVLQISFWIEFHNNFENETEKKWTDQTAMFSKWRGTTHFLMWEIHF